MGVDDRWLLGAECLGHTCSAPEPCVCRAGRAACDFPFDAVQDRDPCGQIVGPQGPGVCGLSGVTNAIRRGLGCLWRAGRCRSPEAAHL